MLAAPQGLLIAMKKNSVAAATLLYPFDYKFIT